MRGSVALTPNRKEPRSRETANGPRTPRPHPSSVSFASETSTSFAMPARCAQSHANCNLLRARGHGEGHHRINRSDRQQKRAPGEDRDQVCVEMPRRLNCGNRIRDRPHLPQSQEWIDLRYRRPQCLVFSRSRPLLLRVALLPAWRLSRCVGLRLTAVAIYECMRRAKLPGTARFYESDT
jgi:hypothetical protein